MYVCGIILTAKTHQLKKWEIKQISLTKINLFMDNFKPSENKQNKANTHNTYVNKTMHTYNISLDLYHKLNFGQQYFNLRFK